MKVAYLFLNGEQKGSSDFYEKYITEHPGDIFCADGGANILEKTRQIPLELWGDFDSLSQDIITKYRDHDVIIKKFPVQKDATDGELLIKHINEHHYDNIYIVGGIGGRTDHMLANLQWLFLYKGIIFLTEKEQIIASPKHLKINGRIGDTVSFIPYSEVVRGISLHGFEYALDNYDLYQGDSRCMSNIVIDEECTIDYTNGKLICIINNKNK